MVCDRCIKVVKEELTKNNIKFVKVELGKIYVKQQLVATKKETLERILEKEGFQIVDQLDSILVNKIKTLIIEYIHYGKQKSNTQSYSSFLAATLKTDYSHLSKIFSELEENTIEHFTIQQKIERAKELLMYNELSLSQISYDLNYSSPQHLSRQFKQITGITPSQFKTSGFRNKLDTI